MYASEEHYAQSKSGSRDKESGFLKFLRCVLMAMNALLTAAAIGGLVVGLIDRGRLETTLHDLCTNCKGLFLAYIIVFSVLLAFSVLGFLALCTRNCCLRAVYFFYLFLVFCTALAISIAYTLITSGRINLSSYWDSAAEKGDRLCQMELDLKCSGWNRLCNAIPVNASFSAQRLSATSLEVMDEMSDSSDYLKDGDKCPVCKWEDQWHIMNFTTTCESVVVGTLKKHSKEAIPIGFTTVGIALVAMIVTCLAHREYEREERYGGRYYRV